MEQVLREPFLNVPPVTSTADVPPAEGDFPIKTGDKVFDSVCHRKLLAKLECYGIRDPLLKCFNSYHIGRLQRAVLNGLYSNWNEVKSGIPKASVLEPTLFFLICQWHAKLYNWDYAGNVCWRFKVLQMQWITRWLWHHPNWLKPPTTLVVDKRNDLPAQNVWKPWGFKETHKSMTILLNWWHLS